MIDGNEPVYGNDRIFSRKIKILLRNSYIHVILHACKILERRVIMTYSRKGV